MSQFDAPESVVAEVVAAALAEDFGLLGDITSIACIREDQTAHPALFVAREEGVLAGTALVDETYRQVDGELTVTWHVNDGDPVEAGVELGGGQRIAAIDSRRRERRPQLSVSLLGRRVADSSVRGAPLAGRPESSILARRCPACAACSAPRCVPAVASTTETRFATAVLIKDNHLAALASRRPSSEPVSRWPVRTIEVECETLEQVGEACDAGVDVVMLDNMTPEEVEKAVALVDGRAKTEVSGTITPDTVGLPTPRPASTSSPSARSPTRCVCSTSDWTSNDTSMLLTIDAGNTQTVVGLFRDRDLLDTWRIATVADRTSDELALMIQQFLGFHGFSFALARHRGGRRRESIRRATDHRRVDLLRCAARHRRAAADDRALLRLSRARPRAGRAHRHAHPLRQPEGGRTRPHRQRGRRLRPLRRPDDHRRLRHGDDRRSDQRGGRIPRRRHLSRRRDRHGRVVRARGRIASSRASGARST